MSTQGRNTRKGRPRQPIPETLPNDLYDYADDPVPRQSPRRDPSAHVFDIERLPVIDDWPKDVPITEAEIQVFERWFADVFEEMFGSVDLPDDLRLLSHYDNEKP